MDWVVALEDAVAEMKVQICAVAESSAQMKEKCHEVIGHVALLNVRYLESVADMDKMRHEVIANTAKMNDRMAMLEVKQSSMTRTMDKRLLRVEQASADALHRLSVMFSMYAAAKPEECPSGPTDESACRWI